MSIPLFVFLPYNPFVDSSRLVDTAVCSFLSHQLHCENHKASRLRKWYSTYTAQYISLHGCGDGFHPSRFYYDYICLYSEWPIQVRKVSLPMYVHHWTVGLHLAGEQLNVRFHFSHSQSQTLMQIVFQVFHAWKCLLADIPAAKRDTTSRTQLVTVTSHEHFIWMGVHMTPVMNINECLWQMSLSVIRQIMSLLKLTLFEMSLLWQFDINQDKITCHKHDIADLTVKFIKNYWALYINMTLNCHTWLM